MNIKIQVMEICHTHLLWFYVILASKVQHITKFQNLTCVVPEVKVLSHNNTLKHCYKITF